MPEPRVYGGDLFTTNCGVGSNAEENTHAWRVEWDEPGWPVRCKWCDMYRYERQRIEADGEE